VDWAQLTASALKKRLKVVDDSPSFLWYQPSHR
jgi:hypothetical protein